MYTYLNVRSDSKHTEFANCEELRAFLLEQPELIEKGPVEFENAEGHPWFHLLLLRARDDGCYNSDGGQLERCNLVELIGSADYQPEFYLLLMRRIAHFLGWEVADITNE